MNFFLGWFQRKIQKNDFCYCFYGFPDAILALFKISLNKNGV